jgi:4-hydroxy-3-methylbut-2-enyl diphosphate reductase
VHKQALRHQRRGRHVLLIGHGGHPEVIGTMGQLPEGAVTLVEDETQAAGIVLPAGLELGYVTQTTLSVDDTAGIIRVLQERFPSLQAPAAESICYATTNRQQAVREAAPGTDLFLVVGASNSSNSRRLVEVAERAGAGRSLLVQRATDIPWEELGALATVGLSAGASAPEIIIDEIIAAFRAHYPVVVDPVVTAIEDEDFPVMRSLRDVEMTAADMAFVNGGS